MLPRLLAAGWRWHSCSHVAAHIPPVRCIPDGHARVLPDGPLEEARACHYGQRCVSAEEAIAALPSGSLRVVIGSGAAEPAQLVSALMARGPALSGSEVLHILTLGPAPYVQAPHTAHFRHTAFFMGANVRAAVNQGDADFVPVFLSEIPQLLRARPPDVALIQVSPPDAHGFCSLGVSVDVVHAAVQSARLVIAEVNPRMPRTHGDAWLPVDRIHYFVHVDDPLPTLVPTGEDEVAERIGQFVADLVPNGATIQMGIGHMPDAIATALRGHRDLGVHSEVLSPGVMRLAEAGVVTGAAKRHMPGKIVATLALGDEALYEWMHDNPMVSMHPCDFTNDPATIAANNDMVAVNAAIAIDLTGQVAADSLHGQFYSGIGGQVDFMRGAARSVGGKPIIALPSTAAHGTVSRIVSTLTPGDGIVTSRGDVHYVVTEYGVASLWGKTVRQRAEELTSIAHPDYREELRDYARAKKWVQPALAVP